MTAIQTEVREETTKSTAKAIKNDTLHLMSHNSTLPRKMETVFAENM